MKTFNVDEATAWVEGKKQDLIKLDTVTENAFNEISENKGIEIAKFIKNISPDNMYILCKSKIFPWINQEKMRFSEACTIYSFIRYRFTSF